MPESWEFTEKEAAEHPAVILHRAKLAATTEARRKREEEEEERRRKRQEEKDERRRKRMMSPVEKRREKRGEKLQAAEEGTKVLGKAVKGYLTEKVSPKEIPAKIGRDVKAVGKATGRIAGKAAIETYKRAPEIGEAAGEAGVSIFKTIFSGLRGQPVERIKKPVHPDKLVRNKELYFGGSSVPNEMMPLGRPMTDWRELYFGTKPVQKDSSEVLNALMSGAQDMESIQVYTGLNEQKIKGALRFLQQQGYDVKFVEEE